MKVFFSPHADDETLFGAFTLIRERPLVVVCFPSTGDYGPTDVRLAETRAAVGELGAGPVEQWQGGDLAAEMRAFDAKHGPLRVWAPDVETSHPDHAAVAHAALEVFGDRVTRYHTYADGQKIPLGPRCTQVAFEPAWTQRKLRALAHYTSQIQHPRANQFFMQNLFEYEVPR